MIHPESGSKIHLECEEDGRIFAYLRDDDPDIPYPGMWDLPGGGIEPSEDRGVDPGEVLLKCAYRELDEEFGLRIPLSLLYVQPSLETPGKLMGRVHGVLTAHDVGRISFGSEGQKWGLFTIDEIATMPFVPQLREFCIAQSLPLTA